MQQRPLIAELSDCMEQSILDADMVEDVIDLSTIQPLAVYG